MTFWDTFWSPILAQDLINAKKVHAIPLKSDPSKACSMEYCSWDIVICICKKLSNIFCNYSCLKEEEYDPTKVCGIYIKDLNKEDTGPWT